MTQEEKDAAKAAQQAEKDAAKAADSTVELDVTDPLVARPVELPLVVKPAKGSDWKNAEQAEYAKILNAAAYAHPDKWTKNQEDTNGKEIPNSSIKDIELKRLVEIGTNPARYYVYTGSNPIQANLSYKNKLLDK